MLTRIAEPLAVFISKGGLNKTREKEKRAPTCAEIWQIWKQHLYSKFLSVLKVRFKPCFLCFFRMAISAWKEFNTHKATFLKLKPEDVQP